MAVMCQSNLLQGVQASLRVQAIPRRSTFKWFIMSSSGIPIQLQVIQVWEELGGSLNRVGEFNVEVKDPCVPGAAAGRVFVPMGDMLTSRC